MSEVTIIADYARGTFFRIGYVAKKCSRKPQSIANLHLLGIIPEPRFRDTSNNRLYTMPQLECLVFAFREFGHYISLDKLKTYMAERWPDTKEVPDGGRIDERSGSDDEPEY